MFRFLVLIYLGLANPTHAGVDLGTDFFLAGNVGQGGNSIHVRTRNSLMFGVGSFALGPIVRIEPQHDYLTDLTYGAGLRFGREVVVELEAAIVRRKFEGVSGNGFLSGALVGWQFTRNFRIAVPVTAKYITVGNDKRWTVDYLPYLGMRVVF
ncbi:MAG: hypothetical protein JNL01_08745 [Bdellovibrionales bacterium]|nr:hypothetical protein [Bdellovibrionales bacterium]